MIFVSSRKEFCIVLFAKKVFDCIALNSPCLVVYVNRNIEERFVELCCCAALSYLMIVAYYHFAAFKLTMSAQK